MRRGLYLVAFLALLTVGGGYGWIPAVWKNAGTPLGVPTSVDCSTGTTCSMSGSALTVTAGGGGYTTIQEDGTPLTQRATVNFTGTAITCSDSGGITVCNVSGGGSGLTHPEVMTRAGAFGGF